MTPKASQSPDPGRCAEMPTRAPELHGKATPDVEDKFGQEQSVEDLGNVEGASLNPKPSSAEGLKQKTSGVFWLGFGAFIIRQW